MWNLLLFSQVAALPPDAAAKRELALLSAVAELRTQADTVVRLQVGLVRQASEPINTCTEQVNFTISATVIEVMRASDALEAGDTLQFRHTIQRYREDTACDGPRQYGDAVQRGQERTAHLSCSGAPGCTTVSPYGALWSDFQFQSALSSARSESHPEPRRPSRPRPQASEP